MSRQKTASAPIFQVTASELQQLFERNQSDQSRLQILRQHGSTEGLVAKLATSDGSGIMGDSADIARRTMVYGANLKPKPTRASYWDSVKDTLNDRILICVAFFAVVSIIPGMIVEPSIGWLEGVVITAALIIQVMITAANDYSKDSKFIKLQSKNKNEQVTALRGKLGMRQTLSNWGLVVGDVVELQPGDQVPADCLVMSSANLKVREPTKTENPFSEVTLYKWKELFKKEDFMEHEMQVFPFLIADSFILNGTCKALVCAVGQYSTRGIQGDTYDTRNDVQSSLSDKLDNIGGSLRFIGLIGAIATLATSMLVLILQTSIDEEVGGKIFMKKLTENIVIALIMLIVAIPEGLPMTVQISLAHSVLQMDKYDDILVRDLSSIEKVGLITDLCCGKTGTMTTEEMEVVNFYTQSIFVLNSKRNTLFNCELDQGIIDKLIESICFNTQAHIEMTENSFYKPEGQGTEVSMIKWLQDAEVAVHDKMMQTEGGRVLAHVPFDSNLKRSIIVVNHPELENTIRIYVKGAPEIVIPKCRSTYARDDYGNVQKVPVQQRDGAEMNEIFDDQIAGKNLRGLAFAYSDMSFEDWNQLMHKIDGDFDSENEIAYLERNLTFLAMVGLKDPLRPGIKKTVETVLGMNIQIRLISGDALNTTFVTAQEAGIISKKQGKDWETGVNPGLAMDGAQFRATVGDVVETENEMGPNDEEVYYSYSLSPEGQQQFERIIGDLRVIGRANPEDKLRLVAGLRGMIDYPEDAEEGAEGIPSRTVAVVGEGINDIKAFKAADVSFALADGVSYARNNCSMVLKSNSFDSCMKSVMWGRNIFLNVQRFLQFQITCNFAILVTVIFSYATTTDSALNAVQLIYVNLIMDVLGAIALASTRPTADICHEHFSPQGKLMTPQMYRQIFLTMLYMVAIMIVVMHCGQAIFDLDYDNSTQATDKDDEDSSDKLDHFTLIFSTFIWLQWFNMINCRDVGREKMQGFSGLLSNWSTLFVLLALLGVQFLATFTSLMRPIFETRRQEAREIMITVLMGASVLIANSLWKLIPNTWIDAKMPSLDETKSIGSSSKMMAAYDKQASAKAYQKKPKAEQVDQEGDGDDGFERA